jgi:hypothetical protein
MKPRIGIDLDNTIVSYDQLMHKLARHHGWIGPDVRESKKSVRDAVRKLPDGHVTWQKLQGEAYGPRMKEASIIPGVREFFQRCREGGVDVSIVSHKTEFAAYDPTGTNLRQASLDWLRNHKIPGRHGSHAVPRNIYFESTRREKIERIVSLQCTHFIDDLEETFLEDYFPRSVVKILYDPHGYDTIPADALLMTSWHQITRHFFRS